MHTTRLARRIAIYLAIGALTGSFAYAQTSMGRVSGVVVDKDDQPLDGVTITATTLTQKSYEETRTTNKKGKFLLAHTDATLIYVYRFEKAGFQTLVADVQPKASKTVRLEFVLKPGTAAMKPPATGLEVTGDVRALQVFNEGVEAQRSGDLEVAEEKFRRASKIDPELAAAHTQLAMVAQLRGNFEAAAGAAERALQLDPGDVRAMEVRFEAYRKSGNEAKAEEAAAALAGIGDTAEAAKRVHNDGVAAFAAGDTAAAISKFMQAVRLDPDLVPALLALAKIHARDGTVSEAALMAAEVVEREPGNVEALKIQYDVARRLGNLEIAEQALAGLSTADPEWVAFGLFDHSVDLFNKGDQEGAAMALEKVLGISPDNAKGHYLLGMIRFNSGDQAAAKLHLSRFLELAPDDPDAAVARDLLSYAQ